MKAGLVEAIVWTLEICETSIEIIASYVGLLRLRYVDEQEARDQKRKIPAISFERED
jgi:hypothetical protein